VAIPELWGVRRVQRDDFLRIREVRTHLVHNPGYADPGIILWLADVERHVSALA
jgi:hypothetical protein